MSWIANQDCEMLRAWAMNSAIPLIASGANGEIYWANIAFEHFIGYSEFELTQGNNGKGITWDQLSLNDGNLQADRRMVDELLAGRRTQYTIRKQYVPKNEKPVWVELHVIRWPLAGEVKCFLVIVSPLKNGSQMAAQIASEQMSQVVAKIEELKQHHQSSIAKIEATIAPKTESEQIANAIARLANSHPKATVFIMLVILSLFLGAQLVQAVDGVKRMLSPTVIESVK